MLQYISSKTVFKQGNIKFKNAECADIIENINL